MTHRTAAYMRLHFTGTLLIRQQWLSRHGESTVLFSVLFFRGYRKEMRLQNWILFIPQVFLRKHQQWRECRENAIQQLLSFYLNYQRSVLNAPNIYFHCESIFTGLLYQMSCRLLFWLKIVWNVNGLVSQSSLKILQYRTKKKTAYFAIKLFKIIT